MPDWKQIVRVRLAHTNLEPTNEADIVDELAQHLEERYQALRSEGANEAEAYSAAVDELSESEILLHELRQMKVQSEPLPATNSAGGRNWFVDLRQDVRYGFRTLRRQPVFTLIAILTLALGIGANTAMFSVVNGVLLRPLGFHEPERLVMIWTDNPTYQLGFHEFPAANSDLPEWRATATSFEKIAAFQSTSSADLSEDGDPERIGAVEVSANFCRRWAFNR